MTNPEKLTLKVEAHERLEQLLEERIDEQTMTLDEIEAVVEEIGREMNAWLEERLIRQQEPLPANRAACPECAQPGRYKRTLLTTVLTSHGSRQIPRRYHHCACCKKGFSPIDAVLGLEEGRDATRRIRAWQAKYGSEDSFATVPELLRELRGVEVSESTVERTTVEVGQAVYAAAQKRAVGPPAPREIGTGGRWYLSLDGVYCPLRERWRRDGSLGKLVRRYGEVKLGMAFQTERKEGLDTGVVTRGCTATLGDIDEFTPLMLALAEQWTARASERVVLGDGADWIWKLATKHFPDALQILDFFHMSQHLYTVAKAMFPQDAAAATAWVKDAQWAMKRNLGCLVRQKINDWQPETDAAQEIRRIELGFFTGNAERMRYKTFLDKGYMIGSGVIEAGCKHVVAKRVRQSGMHWREETAQAVLAVRAHLKSTNAANLSTYA
jgi:hypothetical protein